MRICLVSPYDWSVPGGVNNHIAHLAVELRARGHEAEILAPGIRGRAEPHVHGVGRAFPVRYNGSVARISLGPESVGLVRRALTRGGFDLVHVHEPLVPNVGLAATWSAPVPVVGTFHATLGRSVAVRAGGPVLRRAFTRLTSRIAVSGSARDTWQRWFAGAMTVVPNGVGPEFFQAPAPRQALRDGSPTIVFVGRMEPRKGLADLVRAYVRLKPAFPHLRLVVVGPDDPARRAQLLALVPPRVCADVVFTGRVAQADLPSYYASADVFCSPATGGESFGIVLAEAMAVGVAIVCSDIPGYRDLVRDNAEGLMVAPNDPAGLATAIGSLLDNPARRAALGEAARRSAARYAWTEVAGEILQVYRQALER